MSVELLAFGFTISALQFALSGFSAAPSTWEVLSAALLFHMKANS